MIAGTGVGVTVASCGQRDGQADTPVFSPLSFRNARWSYWLMLARFCLDVDALATFPGRGACDALPSSFVKLSSTVLSGVSLVTESAL